MLDVLTQTPNPQPAILHRAAMLNAMAHNLDVPGAAAKADKLFQQLLALQPGDAKISFRYGVFLASSGQTTRALPYLEKAQQAGVKDADYSLGLLYLGKGDKAQALEHLDRYRQGMTGPTQRMDDLLDAIKNNRVQVKTEKAPAS